MNTKTMFQNYRNRIVRIGILKSLILALIVGFAVNGIAALATWFIVGLSVPVVLGVSVGLGVLAFALCVPIIYYIFFRPTTYRIAQLLDRLGLEERMITMYELENDDSYIAMRQREDAKSRLGGVGVKQLRLKLSTLANVLLAVSFVFALSFTTVSTLASANIIPSGVDIGKGDGSGTTDAFDGFTVNYFVLSGNGRIVGESPQLVKEGQNTTQVTAFADDGYVFSAWTDATGEEVYGLSPTRMEFNVKSDLNIYAIFVETKTGNYVEGDYGDRPGDDSILGGDGQDTDMSDGGLEMPPDKDGASSDSDSNPSDDRDGSGMNGGQVNSKANNTVIDGKQDYHDVFDYEGSEDSLAENDSIPDDLKDILGNYYESLKPSEANTFEKGR